MSIPEHRIKTDVLIIGGGFAGCFASLRARELGAEVLLVEQGKTGFAGYSSCGTHLHRIVLPEDDFDLALKYCVRESDYMVDQDYAAKVIRESEERFNDWLELGSDFVRDRDGNIEWYFHQTYETCFQPRMATWLPWNSYEHSNNVRNGAVRAGAELIDRIVVTELLTDDNGKVIGAVGMNKRTGDFYVFQAKAVILASGTSTMPSGEQVVSYQSLTGDGVGMALRVGAELRNMEFSKAEAGRQDKHFDIICEMARSDDLAGYFHNIAFDVGKNRDKNVRNESTKIVNAKGEEFLEQYEKLYKRPDRTYGGPPWARTAPAYWKEWKEGRGPLFCEMTGPMKFLDGEVCLVGHHMDQTGGVRIEPTGATTVQGLYAAGITSDMCASTMWTIPHNILGSQCTGRYSGESAANFAKDQDHAAIDEARVAQLKLEIYEPLDRQKGMTESDVRLRALKTHPYLDLRTEKNLTRAYGEFRQLEKDATELKAGDIQDLARCVKLKNLLQDLQATALAALERKESRLDHQRHDFPLKNNKDVKWVIVSGTGDDMKARLEDIPFHKWKYKPEPVMVDPLEPRKTWPKKEDYFPEWRKKQ